MYRVVVIFCMLIPVGFCYGQLSADDVQTMIKGKLHFQRLHRAASRWQNARQLTPGYTTLKTTA